MRPRFLDTDQRNAGAVLMAKLRGLIPSAGEVIRALVNVGFRLDEHLIRDALARTVDETWSP